MRRLMMAGLSAVLAVLAAGCLRWDGNQYIDDGVPVVEIPSVPYDAPAPYVPPSTVPVVGVGAPPLP